MADYSTAYAAALAKIEAATETYDKVVKAYRAGKIDDYEYLEARYDYEAVEAEFDAAYEAETA